MVPTTRSRFSATVTTAKVMVWPPYLCRRGPPPHPACRTEVIEQRVYHRKLRSSEARRRVAGAGSGARRARFATDLGAEALKVGDPHHGQAEGVRPLYDQVHVMLGRGDVVALDVEALVGQRLDRLALAQRGDADFDPLVDPRFLAGGVHLAHHLEVQDREVRLLEVEEDAHDVLAGVVNDVGDAATPVLAEDRE